MRLLIGSVQSAASTPNTGFIIQIFKLNTAKNHRSGVISGRATEPCGALFSVFLFTSDGSVCLSIGYVAFRMMAGAALSALSYPNRDGHV